MIVAAIALVLHVAVVSAETIDRVLAVVAGQLIMLSDVTVGARLASSNPLQALIDRWYWRG